MTSFGEKPLEIAMAAIRFVCRFIILVTLIHRACDTWMALGIVLITVLFGLNWPHLHLDCTTPALQAPLPSIATFTHLYLELFPLHLIC